MKASTLVLSVMLDRLIASPYDLMLTIAYNRTCQLLQPSMSATECVRLPGTTKRRRMPSVSSTLDHNM